MVVRTQLNGRQVTGLYIGVRNARRHFRKHIKDIELQLGHLHIHCELAPDFWRGRPEIRDPRLNDWLQSRIFHERSCRAPVPLAMIPEERNSFRLLPFKLPQVSVNRLVKIGAGPALVPLQSSGAKSNCGTAACRTRSFITCTKYALL
jgi:hypothetical protein